MSQLLPKSLSRLSLLLQLDFSFSLEEIFFLCFRVRLKKLETLWMCHCEGGEMPHRYFSLHFLHNGQVRFGGNARGE